MTHQEKLDFLFDNYCTQDCSSCVFGIGGCACALASEDIEKLYEEYGGNMESKFTVNDIKPGYRCEMMDGTMTVAIPSSSGMVLYAIDDDGDFWGLTELTNNVLGAYPVRKEDHRYFVRTVYGFGPSGNILSKKDANILWERPSARKMTVKEIEKALGYAVEIVGEADE